MTASFGYALSSEEHPPRRLVELAVQAERAGFEFALVSDHYHPWTRRQGQSPFVWGVLGGIAGATERLVVGTGVTCPLIRIHPAVIAQAAATAAALMPGRFFLGVGSGENLNEHVTGARWPSPPERLEMLREAIGLLRSLWEGGEHTIDGRHYRVDHAQVYSLPDTLPPIMVAASGEEAARLAGELGDGLVATSPSRETVEQFLAAASGADAVAGRAGREPELPRYGQLTVCVAESERAGVDTALEWWPNAALGGNLSQELPRPTDFEAACETVRPDDIADSVVCGPDVERHVEKLMEYVEAGFTHVYVHQVGPDQDAFFRLYEAEMLPRVRERAGGARADASLPAA